MLQEGHSGPADTQEAIGRGWRLATGSQSGREAERGAACSGTRRPTPTLTGAGVLCSGPAGCFLCWATASSCDRSRPAPLSERWQLL